MKSVLLAGVLVAMMAWGQGERSGLNGTVTDSSGAAVPGAAVTGTHVETGIDHKALTTSTGVYRLPYLPAGTYKVGVSAPGFRTAVQENVIVRVAQTLTVDFTLEVGQVSEQITVAAEAPLLEASTGEIGRYVTEREFDTWPIPVADGHRQLQSFIFRSLPGAVGNEFQGSINGGQFYSHEILIEGIPLGRMDLQGGSNNEFSPSAESIQEFKLQTGAMGAQYNGGQTSVANFAIKSGTNELHGSAFTYIQNDALSANSASNNAIGTRKSPFKLGNYGGSAGGPVYIPKVYDGRNKTFFFFNYEGTRQRDYRIGGLSTLPTRDFKQGDFTRLFNPGFTGRAQSGSAIGTDTLGRPVRYGQIYDPSTTRMVNGVVVRDPFPNNVIPQNRWSPVSRNIIQQVGIDDPVFDRMLNNIPNVGTCCPVFDERIWGLKADQHFGSSHRLSAFYNHHYRRRNNSPGGRWGSPPGLPTNVYQNQYTPGRMVRIAEDWTITPTLLNHFAIGYNRFGNLNRSVFFGQDWPQKIGLQNVAATHFPALFFRGQSHLGGGIGAASRLGSPSRGESYHGSTIANDDLSIVRGSHNFRLGFELRRYYYNTRSHSGSGDFDFNSLQTQLPGFADQTGHAFASFILGAVASTSRAIATTNFGWRSNQTGLYFQDDWKVTRRMTLNLGLRWETVSPLNEVAGRMSGLDPNMPNPGAAGRRGALVFVEDLDRKSFHNRYWKQISPRFGFAWQMKDRMVVRGGYGIANTPLISNGFGFPGTFGYNGSISLSPSNTQLAFPQDPVMYLHGRYPDFQGTLPNKNPALANGQGIPYVAPDSNRLPYVQNYNFGLQVQLPSRFVLETNYVGNKGTRLLSPGLDQLNQVPVENLRLGDALLEPLSRHPGLVPVPYAGFNGTVGQALRPFPQYQGVGQQFSNFGSSLYNSFQTTLTRHFSGGLGVMAAYTWAKAIDMVDDPGVDGGISAQDVYNRRNERSIASFNIPHFLKLTWIYALPVGKGKPADLGAIGNAILGGWTFTAIHNYRSGNALQIRTSGLRGDAVFNSPVRPDWIPGQQVVVDSGQPVVFGTGAGTQYLNPAAFSQVPRTANNVPVRLGTAPRVMPNIRGPHFLREDFGLMKMFGLSEDARLEFRADFLNAFNRSGRGDPSTDISSPLFGRITGFQQGPRTIQLGARIEF